MTGADALRAGATALYATGEGLHYAVTHRPRAVLETLSRRHDVIDSVLQQIGAEEFHRLLCALTEEACGYIRQQAEQATTLVDEQHAFAQQIVRELGGQTDPTNIRRDCAFCGRERTRADDNHAPDCAYWQFFPADGT